MFTQFYGMREQPFGVTPDSRYLYLSHTHREALASLYCGIRDHRGFLALIAPPGTGKTTVLFYLLKRLRAYSRTVFLFDSPSDPEDLMSSLAADIGLNTWGLDNAQIKQQFHRVLIQEASAERTFVIVVDEAQNLPNSVLEKLRLLSNFESGTHKLLQVVLAGQPQLATRLSHPDLIQLRQRLAMMTHLEPLSPDQVRSYIQHRLNVAGCDSGLLFTRDALALVANESRGVPRNINILCYNALALGCAQKRKCIDVGIVKQVASDLALEEQMKVAGVRACPSAAREIRVHNNSWLHRGNTKQHGAIIVSTKRGQPSFSALTKMSIGVAMLLIIIIPLGVTPLARSRVDPKTQIQVTRPARLSTAGSSLPAPVPATGSAQAATTAIHRSPFVTDIRYWSEPTSTMVGIELEEQVKYEIHRLTSPDRVYLDLYGSRLGAALLRKQIQVDDRLVRKVRIGEVTGTLTRVTLETYGPCDFSVLATSHPAGLFVELRSEQQLPTHAMKYSPPTESY